jgi:hypothetical protein
VEARRRWIVFGIVFAAFFGVKVPELPDSGYSLCKPANARVDYSTKHCSNSDQRNVALQQSD